MAKDEPVDPGREQRSHGITEPIVKKLDAHLRKGTQHFLTVKALTRFLTLKMGLLGHPRWLASKESTCKCRRHSLDP